MFPIPKTSYMEENTQKNRKTENLGPECTLMRLWHEVCAPRTKQCGPKILFPTFCGKKAGFLGQLHATNFEPRMLYLFDFVGVRQNHKLLGIGLKLSLGFLFRIRSILSGVWVIVELGYHKK